MPAGLCTVSDAPLVCGARSWPTLAGISNDYYIRLERGRETRPSPEVVDALARALRLVEDEHEHLRSLATLASSPAAGLPGRRLASRRLSMVGPDWPISSSRSCIGIAHSTVATIEVRPEALTNSATARPTSAGRVQ